MSCDNPGSSVKEDIMPRNGFHQRYLPMLNTVQVVRNSASQRIAWSAKKTEAMLSLNTPCSASLSISTCFLPLIITLRFPCRTCFFPFVTAKFKKALDRYIKDTSRRKFLDASGNLLLGFSGGLGSTVLMDIVNDNYLSRSNSMKGGKNHPHNDRIWDKVYVCYVETCTAFREVSRS